MQVVPIFIAVGCNGVPNCISWSSSGIIAYGAGSMIALYDSSHKSVLKTLLGHTRRVNSVEWIEPSSRKNDELPFSPFLISCSSDGSIRYWEDNKSTTLCAEDVSITSVKSLVLRSNDIIVAAATSDARILIWKRNRVDNQWIKFEDIVYDNGCIAECLSLRELHTQGKSCLLLASGGVDSKIRIHSINQETQKISTTEQLVILKGHMDWITSLDFTRVLESTKEDDFFLASASQDHKIRIWRFSFLKDFPLFRESSCAEIKTNHRVILNYEVSHEALLVGHENWVSCVRWSRNNETLYSSSVDSTIILWKCEVDDDHNRVDKKESSGAWIPHTRMGESSYQGFLSICFNANETMLATTSRGGSFQIWKKNEATNLENKETILEEQDSTLSSWFPIFSCSGNTDAVTDLIWNLNCTYFFTTSLDQSTRLYSLWKEKNTWHEFSRPQVHGYNLKCITLDRSKSHQFVSGGDEKILRVFTAPQGVLESLYHFTDLKREEQQNSVYAAYAPELSLTNKTEEREEEKSVYDKDSTPPLETTLNRSLLWPEIQKLYGHGSDLLAVSSTCHGDLLASACKGRDIQSCSIILWDTTLWIPVQQLSSHTSSVVSLAFSSNSQYLLSVSKDRHWSLFKRKKDSLKEFYLVQRYLAHKRIIWSCSWSRDDEIFATASRDQTVKLWVKDNRGDEVKEEEKWISIQEIPFSSAVTSIAFTPYEFIHIDILAIGLENGEIHLWSSSKDTNSKTFTCLTIINPLLSHASTVSKLVWKPIVEMTNSLVLSSCSFDHSVRLFTIELDKN